MFARSAKPLNCEVDVIVPAPTPKNPDPNGFVVIAHEDTAFTASVRINSETAVANATLITILFVGQGGLPEKTTKFDPQSSTAAASIHRKPIFKSVKQIWTGNDIKAGANEFNFTVDVDSNVPPTVTDPTVSDIKRDITYVLYAVLKVGNQQAYGRKDILLRRGTVWSDPKRILLEGPMLDGRVKYQLFVPNIVHIGDPTASITIILNNLGNHLLQLKSVQCTWVEVYTFEEPGRSPVSREHTMAKVLKLQDAFPTATDEVTQKFAIPQTEAAPDCDHRAVAPNVHPLLKAYGGSACITHEVRIKVEYKLGRQVNLMLDGILARIPFNNVVHTGSGAIIKAKHGVSSSGTRMGRLSVMSGSSSSAGSISSPTTPRAGSIAPSSYGLPRRGSVSSMASGASAAVSVANTMPPTPLYSSPTVASHASVGSSGSTPSSAGYPMARSATSPLVSNAPGLERGTSHSSAVPPAFTTDMDLPPPPTHDFGPPSHDFGPPIPMTSSDITAHILENSEAAGALPTYELFIDPEIQEEEAFMAVPQEQLGLPTYSYVTPRGASLANTPPASPAAAPTTFSAAAIGGVLDPSSLPPRTASSRTAVSTAVTSAIAAAAAAPVPATPISSLPAYLPNEARRTHSLMKGPLPGQVERTDTSSSSSSSATAVSNTSYLFPPATAPSVPMPTVSRPASPTLAPSNPPQASGAPSYDGAPEDSASTEHFTRLMRVETVMLSEPPPPFSEFFEVEDEPAPAPYTPHELESVREDVLEAPPPAHNELAAYTTLPRNAHADEAPAPYTTLPRASQADEAPAPYTSLPRTSHVDEAPAVYTTLPRGHADEAPAAYTTLPRDTATDVNNVPSAHQDSPAVYDSPPQEGGSNGPPAFTAIPEQEEEPEMIWELCNVQEVAVGRYEPATDGEINVEIGDIVFVRSAWVDGFAYGINLSRQVEGLFHQAALFGPPAATSQPPRSVANPNPNSIPSPPNSPPNSVVVSRASTKRRSLPPSIMNPPQPAAVTALSLNRPIPTPHAAAFTPGGVTTQRSASVGIMSSSESPVRPVRSTSFVVGGRSSRDAGPSLTPPKRSGSFMTGGTK